MEAAKSGAKCHFASILQRGINPFNDYAAYQQVTRLLRQIKPDIVHTHSSKPGIIGRFAARRAGVPVVVHTVQGFSFPATSKWLTKEFFEKLEYMAGKRCDAVICVNQSDFEFTATFLRVPKEKVFLIHNGVALDAYRPAETNDVKQKMRKELLGFDERPLVMSVGRLWEQKNPELFIRAACQLLREGIDANFAIAGDGPLDDSLNRIIREANSQDRVHLLGWRSDISGILPLADVFLLSSNWEGMPLVLLEANACAVPAIATDIPGSRDVIRDGETGLLARPNDQADLAGKIRYLIENPDVRQQMADRCRDHVSRLHDINSRQKKLVALYFELLKRKGKSGLAASLIPAFAPLRKSDVAVS